MYPSQLENLIFALQRLPGVGAKTAERYAFTIMDWAP
ncbi:MAG TPA: recombination protein RecR, partial [Erysipelotrichaceae bacterium]|nr:recombination protein RecR [Erysipelotrichaceae bacterium]